MTLAEMFKTIVNDHASIGETTEDWSEFKEHWFGMMETCGEIHIQTDSSLETYYVCFVDNSSMTFEFSTEMCYITFVDLE